MQIRFADRRPTATMRSSSRSPARTDRDRLAALGDEPRGGRGGAATRQRFEGEAGAAAEHVRRRRRGAVRRLLLVGTGDGNATADARREARRSAVARLLTSGETHAGDRPHRPRLRRRRRRPGRARRRAARAGATTATGPSSRTSRSRRSSEVVDRRRAATGAEQRWSERWQPVLEGVALTRELVTEPANIIYPETLRRARAASRSRASALEIEVLDGAAMAQARHGRAARRRPGLGPRAADAGHALERRRRGRRSRSAFVGKGVTFDTGGISIKPAPGMEAMKWDMGGAGAVAGAMKALAARKAKANVVGDLRPGREHARRQRPAPGRRRHHHVGPDDRGDQHRRRRPAGARATRSPTCSATTSRRRSSTWRR